MRAPWRAAAPAAFVLAWGGNHFTPLLHLYQSVGGYAPWQANLLLGMYVFGLIPGLLAAAAIADRYGRRRTIIVGLVAAIAGSALLAAGMESFTLLCAGRALAGIGVGIGMSVGSTWIKELSDEPWEHGAVPLAGAKRSTMTLTLGFGIGAGVTGALAQWAPWPGVTPFVLHLALCLVALVAALRAPESLGAPAPGLWWRAMGIPAVRTRTFRRIVLPATPWVFASAGVACAVIPSVVEHRLGDAATLYATVLTVLTLGLSAAAQPFAARIDRWTGGRAMLVGLGGIILAMALAVVAAIVGDPVLGVVVAAIAGISLGVLVISGLVVAQRLAGPEGVAGVTGAYYSLTYFGFLLPTVLAALLPVAPYAVTLAASTAVCALCSVAVAMALPRKTRLREEEPGRGVLVKAAFPTEE